jgi:hypothetical protein
LYALLIFSILQNYGLDTATVAAALASCGFNAWAWACVALGTFGAVTSGIGAGQQFKMAGEVGQEIQLREGTQDFNEETMGAYEESIDGYDGVIQGVEELEMVIPNDLEAPKETELPAAAAAASQAPTQQPAPTRAPEASTENTNKVKKKGNVK